MLIVVGAPIVHNNATYNCNIFIYQGRIILIRPKTILADDGNYREARYFTAWQVDKYDDKYIYTLEGQEYETPIGLYNINLDGVIVAAEICEELWVPRPLHSDLYLDGVDVVLNGSGSHFEVGKLDRRKELINEATKRSGGIYAYSNLKGGDGQRLYFDGASMISVNGELLEEPTRFNLKDVEVMTKEIPLSQIFTSRVKNNSYQTQASKTKRFPVIILSKTNPVNKYNHTIHRELKGGSADAIKQIIDDLKKENTELKNREKERVRLEVEKENKLQKKQPQNKLKFDLGESDDEEEEELVKDFSTDQRNLKFTLDQFVTQKNKNKQDDKQIEELMNAASCWMFDYLSRSGASGFVLPLSGGADSAVTALLTYNMCRLMIDNIKEKRVKDFLTYYNHYINMPTDADPKKKSQILCKFILNSVYLPTSNSSSTDNDVPTYDLEFDKSTTNEDGSKKCSKIIKHLTKTTKVIFDRNNVDGTEEDKNNKEKEVFKEIADEFSKAEPGTIVLTTRFLSYYLALEIGASWYEISIEEPYKKTLEAIKDITGLDADQMKAQVSLARTNYKNNMSEFINNQLKDSSVDVTRSKKWDEFEKTFEHNDWKEKSPLDIAYQNIQARFRMVTPYLLSQIIPVAQRKTKEKKLAFKGKHTEIMENNEKKSPYYMYDYIDKEKIETRLEKAREMLLVLGSSNMDEILYGYYTKYDASAADINPIGSLPKRFIKRTLKYVRKNKLFKFASANLIADATPSAELITLTKEVNVPVAESGAESSSSSQGGKPKELKPKEKSKPFMQSDETDMRLYYDQIYEIGKLRARGYGPSDVYNYIVQNKDKKTDNGETYFDIFSKTPNGRVFDRKEFKNGLQTKIFRFFKMYAINRNKTTIIPPSVHLFKSPDDNRFDLRPFLLTREYFLISNFINSEETTKYLNLKL
jgi:NH3-dependent NAD+ synthetase/predicted amidohydrolase